MKKNCADAGSRPRRSGTAGGSRRNGYRDGGGAIRVCHMTSAHDTEDVRIFRKECVSLARAGYEVYLVERGNSYDKDGVHMIGVGEIPENRLRRMTEGASAVYRKALDLNADIYHFHDPELLPYGLKLKQKGKAVIFDSHERYPEQIHTKEYLPGPVRSLVANAYDQYERYVLKRLDAVIFPATIGGANPFEGLCRRAAIISNAAVLGEFYDLYDPVAEKKSKQLCYVGGLTEERGITADIKAGFAAGATIALAGSFSSEQYANRLRSMPEFGCVQWRGLLNRREVASLLQESVAGLCTLLNRGQYWKTDNFGIKVYEYMSMGLPVILSCSPYNLSMVDKYHFGICVDPEDTGEIAGAIRYLFEHPDEAKRMGENGRRAVREELNWGVEEKKLLELYDSILETG